jgi:hypothetical protein
MHATVNDVARHWEFQLGFEQWNQECRNACARFCKSTSYMQLVKEGYKRLSSLTAEQCENALGKLKQRQNDDRSTWKVSHNELIAFDENQDSIWIGDLIESVLSPEMEQMIMQFFRSEFMVYSIGFNRIYPVAEKDDISYMWHRDVGPKNHLKIITYFTGSESSGANTEVLNLATTNAVAKAGYAFPDMSLRETDISKYLEEENAPQLGVPTQVKAGDSLVFRPRDVLHRGIFSKKPNEPRYAMTLVIAPSIVHWQEAMDLWPLFIQKRLPGITIDLTYAQALRKEVKVSLAG